MEVHLEQQQESGFLAMGITKLHCDQSPAIPIQPPEPFTPAGQALNNLPKHSPLPTEPGSQCPPLLLPGTETQTPRAAEVPAHRAEPRGFSCSVFHYLQGKAVLPSAEHNGRSSLLKQLISARFWGGAGPLLQLQHLHWTSQHSDLQVLVRCLRSQQLHCELLESITLKLRNFHGKSVGLNTEYPLTRGWNCPALFYFCILPFLGSYTWLYTHTARWQTIQVQLQPLQEHFNEEQEFKIPDKICDAERKCYANTMNYL